MEIKDWFAVLIIVAIVLILLDGFRRKLRERRNRVIMKLDKNVVGADDFPEDEESLAELPNGGARAIPRDAYQDEEHPDQDEYAASMPAVDEEEADATGDDAPIPVLMDSVELSAAKVKSRSRIEPESELEDVVTQGDEADDGAWEDEEDFSADDNIPDEEEASRSEEGGRIEPTMSEISLDELLSGEHRHKGGAVAASKTKASQGELHFEAETDDVAVAAAESPAQSVEKPRQSEEILVINVMAKKGEAFHGKDLLPILMSQGLRLGEMNIFHRHADTSGQGPVMFSMANILNPGTFEMSKMDEFSTPGVSFFLQLPGDVDNMQSFNKMIDAANALKNGLNGELKDENRSVITLQTLEHCRQRIRDFELRQLSHSK